MSSSLHNLAPTDHCNHVGVPDRGESVSDNDDSLFPLLHQNVQSFLYDRFGLAIQSTVLHQEKEIRQNVRCVWAGIQKHLPGGFVKQNDFWFFDEHSSDGNPLFLT
jgi:hypothetical protein